jgi:cyclic dehypoxanthinyl futalosine synthase
VNPGSVTRISRLAAVTFLNARPLWEPLQRAPFTERAELTLGLPSEVARRVAEEEADVGLVPVAALSSLGDSRIVRGIGITSPGPVESVVLVSEVPFDQVTNLALDASSRTSAILARLVMRHRRKRDLSVGVLRTDEAVAAARGTTAALVIGDPALEVRDRFAHVLDLAAAWREWTGLPFVFAAWGGRQGALDRDGEALLREAKTLGLADRGAMAAAHAAARGLPEAKLRAYLETAIRYDLGDDERRGLERFFVEAHAARLLPRTEVRFFDDDAVDPPTKASKPSLDTVLSRAAEGDRLSAAEGERLLAEASLFDLGFAADTVRKRKHPDGVVTYIVDRNVNYTNVCTTSCRFCAFYRPVGHPEGYVLSREVLAQKLGEVKAAGGVQILLQGGLNPDLRIEWYEDLFRWIKLEFALGLHALSPEEIIHIARLENLTIGAVLERLDAAGLDSVPGGGAEILVDRVRRKIAKAKCTSDEWLEVMRVAHHMGLRSSSTMMYGTVDTPRDRILHLLKLRDLQDETNGFTAFFCWDFQHEEGVRIAAGDTGTNLYLRTQAVARLMLDNIDHVGASWVTQGPDIGQLALRFGADDFGSVMFEENVVSSAGTTYCINADEIERRIHSAGFRAVRRNVRYDWLGEPA